MREYDYEVRRGETFEGFFYMLDKDKKPMDLTGYKVKAQIRPYAESEVLTAEMNCFNDNGIGRVSYELTSTQTKSIPPGRYQYDVCLYQDSDGERYVKYFIGGKFSVIKSVTDALNL